MKTNSLLAAQLRSAFLAGVKAAPGPSGPYKVESYVYSKPEEAADAYVEYVVGGDMKPWAPWLVAANRIMIAKHQRPSVPLELYEKEHAAGKTPEEAVAAIVASVPEPQPTTHGG